MATSVIIGYFTEGTTDERFFNSIIQRSFQQLAYDSKFQVTVFEPFHLGKSTQTEIKHQKGALNHYDFILIHIDSDRETSNQAYQNRIQPIIKALDNPSIHIIPIIPVRMTESWMLADQQLLKEVLFTNKTYADLGIRSNVETIADPKACIQNAIRIVNQKRPKKQRGTIVIGELYEILGENIRLSELQRLPSYQQFQDAARQALIKANFLQS